MTASPMTAILGTGRLYVCYNGAHALADRHEDRHRGRRCDPLRRDHPPRGDEARGHRDALAAVRSRAGDRGGVAVREDEVTEKLLVPMLVYSPAWARPGRSRWRCRPMF